MATTNGDGRFAFNGYGMPSVDFSPIGELPADYRQAQLYGARRSLADLAQSGQIDYGTAASRLLAAGDLDGARSLAQLADAKAQREYGQTKDARDFAFRQQESQRTQGNADRSFGLQQKQLDAALEGTKVPPGFQRAPTPGSEGGGYTGQGPFVPNTGGLAPVPGGPQDPSYIEAIAKAKAADTVPTGFEAADGGLRPIQGGPQDPAYIERATKAKGGADALLDDETVKQMAQQYRAGDTSVLTNLGRGAQGAQNIVRLRQEVVRQNAEEGVGGDTQAARNAEYAGTKAGQRTLGTKQANIELAATEFKQVLPVVQAASAKVDRTRFPDLNRVIQAYETRTGDPNIVAFGGGINTLINVYARAISPNGVGTVSDKDHARELLSKAWSQGQFDAAVGMMQQEIDAALTSPEKVREDMRKRFLSGAGGARPTGGAPASAAAAGGIPAPPPGFQLVK